MYKEKKRVDPIHFLHTD